MRMSRLGMNRPDKYLSSFTIAGIYCIVAATWILASDAVVTMIAPAISESQLLQTVKGLAFVLVTSSLLYMLIQIFTRELRSSEHRYFQLFDNAGDMVYVHDLRGTIEKLNRAGLALTGLSPEHDGKVQIEQFFPNGYAQWVMVLGVQSPGRVSVKREMELVSVNGQVIPVEINLTQIVERDSVVAILGVVRDLTERRDAERKVRESQRVLQTLMNNLPGMAYRAAEGHPWEMSFVSAGALDLTGYLPDELMHQQPSFLSLVHPGDSERGWSALREPGLNEGSYQLVYRIRPKNASERWVWEQGCHVYNALDGERTIEGFITDITAIHQAEEVLRQSTESFRLMFAGNPLPLWVLDTETRVFLEVNEAAVATYGYSRAEFLTMSIDTLWPDADWEKFERELVKMQGLSRSGQWRNQTSDGRVIWVETASQDIRFGGRRARLMLANDVTERKAMEEDIRRFNADLETRIFERTEQLRSTNAELQAFTYTVSHDLRAPLRAISGFTQIIARSYAEHLPEAGQHFLMNILKASEQMEQLISDLLNYSRLGKSTIRMEGVPLQRLFSEIAGRFEMQLTERRATLTIPESMPVVVSDPTRLDQIFTNLIGNALVYTKPNMPARVSVRWMREGEYVTVEVADEGPGIPPEFQEKVFNVFQRLPTSKDVPGTGIGLAIVKKAVELLGGKIFLISAVGAGCLFRVQLPAGDVE